jgi:hypothetical protein
MFHRTADGLVQPADVGGKSGHDHPAFRLTDHPVKILGDDSLGRGETWTVDAHTIGEQYRHTLIGNLL